MKRSIIAGLVLAGLLAGGAVVSGSAEGSSRSTVADTSWGGWVCPPNSPLEICRNHHFPRPPKHDEVEPGAVVVQA
ncbi:hypothetical protein [Kitasatospora sp. NPDC101183]|uniref:hypothetical protein n=1 Tax=Kitasatospora sp. NPDC101183 TaxID=3364100 RepID=UPI0038130FDC